MVVFRVGAQGEENIRLAVVDFDLRGQKLDLPDLDKIIPEWLTTFLVQTRTFDVIERQKLEKLLQEQSLGQSGIVDEQSAARVGEILGVNILITGTLIGFENTLEITVRLIDTTNGVLVGVESIMVEDEDELRDRVKELAESISRKLSRKPTKEGIKILDPFDGNTLNTNRWLTGFDDDTKERDKNNTRISQQNGVLRITGKYGKNFDEDRMVWMVPNSDESYYSIEAKIRVREVQGGTSVCLGAGWNEDQDWTGICLYFEDEDGIIIVAVENENKIEEIFDFALQFNQWYTIRVDFIDNQFHYYWNNDVIKRITPTTRVDPFDSYLMVTLALEETQAMIVEIDEMILR
jgi:TolB-like protein